MRRLLRWLRQEWCGLWGHDWRGIRSWRGYVRVLVLECDCGAEERIDLDPSPPGGAT